MDTHPHVPHEAHKSLLEHHKATWRGITRVALFGTIGIIILLALMAAFLVHRSIG